MVNLVPEKRVNKNGVSVTKHVRADAKTPASGKQLPAPKVATKAPKTASTAQKRRRVSVEKWGQPDKELAHICTEVFSAAQTYEASDAEIYDVMSVVSPHNVYPLLAVGMRSGEHTLSFLKDTGLDRLRNDNSNIVEEAIARGYRAGLFLQFAAEYSSYRSGRSMDTFMDAAESSIIPDLMVVNEGHHGQLTSMILRGEILLSDVKEIGTGLVKEHSQYGEKTMLKHLSMLRRGNSAFASASEIRDAIDRSYEARAPVATMLNIMAAFGCDPDRVARFDWNERRRVDLLAVALQETDYSLDERKKFLAYQFSLGNAKVDAEALIELSRHDVSVDEVLNGMEHQLTVAQVVALSKGEVEPGLASGVL